MTEIVIHKSFAGQDAIAKAWDNLRQQEPRFFPSFSEARHTLEATECAFRIVVAKEKSDVVGIACFVNKKDIKRYSVGQKKLIDLPIKATFLVGSSVLGKIDQNTITSMIREGVNEFDFDLIHFGEVIVASDLYRAICNLGGSLIVTRAKRQNSLRWLIRLPKTFDEYLTSLDPAGPGGTVKRKIRKFERNESLEFVVVHRPEQVDKFLLDGEQISRRTYQWHVGQRLYNDASTRERYMRLAEKGELRCYILYVEGRPCAFFRGELSGRIYHYETPGFDPQFSKMSPGTLGLMLAIRELIENTNCELFDFGTGGDNSGYKSSFGNVSLESASLEAGKVYRPYALFLILFQEALSLIKYLGNIVLGKSRVRQRIERAIFRS